MTTINLEIWETAYNEDTNEIRLLVNPYSKDAVLVTLDSTNLTDFLTQLSETSTTTLSAVGRSMVAQELIPTILDDEDGEEGSFYNYRVSDSDLSSFYTSESRPVEIKVEGSGLGMLNSTMWNLGPTLDYVMG